MTRARAPIWLLSPERSAAPLARSGRRRRAGGFEKTLEGLAGLMHQMLANEDIAARSGLLQRLDARIKLGSLLMLLVTAGMVWHIWVLIALYVLVVALALLSRVELGWFLKRVWLSVPLFTGIVVLPATFSFVTPGDTILPLGSWLGHDVAITQQGLSSAGLIVSRVAVSISLVTLVTLTTSWSRLLAALRALFVPRLIVLVLGMALRYLFVLAESTSEMVVARRARTIASEKGARARRTGREGRALVGFSAGALLGKTHALGEEIYQAMRARGYRGEARTLQSFRLRAADGACLALCVFLSIVAIGGDRALGL